MADEPESLGDQKNPLVFFRKKRLGNLVLCLQFLCLGIGFFKGFPSKCTVPLWENIVWLFDFPQRLPLSASGLGASANALGITGAIFIWIVNLAFQQICTVPMKRLYKWAYPHYLFNFIFSEALLLCCIYCGEAAGQDGSPVQAAYFFLGGLCGFIYILHMCIAFVFDASKLKKSSTHTLFPRSTMKKNVSSAEAGCGNNICWRIVTTAWKANTTTTWKRF